MTPYYDKICSVQYNVQLKKKLGAGTIFREGDAVAEVVAEAPTGVARALLHLDRVSSFFLDYKSFILPRAGIGINTE